MQTRELGKSGLRPTILGFGAQELSSVDEATVAILLNGMLDAGVNYIDTAPEYGRSEELIGRHIGKRRSEFYLATKAGCNVDASGRLLPPGHLWTPQMLATNVRRSLQLLKTDHIDILQLHGSTPADLANKDGRAMLTMLTRLKLEGTVGCIGVSFRNGKPGDSLFPAGYAYRYLPELLSSGVFDVMQVVYSALTRLNEELISHAAAQGVGIVARGALRYLSHEAAQQIARARLNELCPDGWDPYAFLLRFAWSHPGISTVIVGTRSVNHLMHNIAAAQLGRLPDEIYRKARVRLESTETVAGLDFTAGSATSPS
jgi:aryl-alcohol dehydrogenase-like predicted oxidoreductase